MITKDLSKVPAVKNKNGKDKKFYTAKYDRIFKTIFIDKNDHLLMESVLSECLGEKVKILEYLKVELGVTNISERTKRLDVLLECNGKKIIVELNTEGPSVNNRNLAFFSKYYGTRTKINKKYKDGYKYILINLSYNVIDKEFKRNYYVQDESGKKYVQDFEIIEFIMDNITKECYDRIMKGMEVQYKHLAMLDLNIEALEKLSEYDYIVKEYMDKLVDLNNDEVFIGPLRIEEDEEAILNDRIDYAREEGEKNKSIEIAKNMINLNMDIDTIVKATGLSKEEIEELMK